MRGQRASEDAGAFASVVEEEFFAGEQRPHHVFERLAPASRCASADPFARARFSQLETIVLLLRVASDSGCRRTGTGARRCARRTAPASRKSATYPSGALSFLFSVSPLITCSACAMLGSLDRSAASQMMRCGPSERRQELRLHLRVGQLQSARVPPDSPAKRVGTPVTCDIASSSTSAGQPLHDVLRVVFVVVLIGRVGFARRADRCRSS